MKIKLLYNLWKASINLPHFFYIFKVYWGLKNKNYINEWVWGYNITVLFMIASIIW